MTDTKTESPTDVRCGDLLGGGGNTFDAATRQMCSRGFCLLEATPPGIVPCTKLLADLVRLWNEGSTIHATSAGSVRINEEGQIEGLTIVGRRTATESSPNTESSDLREQPKT